MIIEKLNGETIDIAAYKLRRLFHYIPMLEKKYDTQRVLGGREEVTDEYYEVRYITVRFMYSVADIYDFYAMRDKWNDIFIQDEPFYIIFKRESGKKWLVRSVGGVTVEPNKSNQEFELEFMCVEEYARSRESVQKLVHAWDADLLQFGLGYEWDVKPIYTFESGVFTVENLGNAPVDSRNYPLTITITGTFPTGFTLKNTTTGESFVYNGSMRSGDVFVIDGVVPTLNGRNVIDNTNMAAITLKSGQNHIILSGGTMERVTFDFYYLFK